MGGGDKCLQLLAGQPLLSHVIERAQPQLATLALNANGNPDRFAKFALPVIADPLGGNPGPLVGVLAGLEWVVKSVPGATHVATIATDTPFFPHDLVSRFAAALAHAPSPIACAASRGRLHPVFGLWPVTLAQDLRAALESGVRKVDRWTSRHGIAVAHFDTPEGDPFFNINTKEELDLAERRVSAPIS
jgi:molybdopterin-guanine dinucleotide biosynthesis protein A